MRPRDFVCLALDLRRYIRHTPECIHTSSPFLSLAAFSSTLFWASSRSTPRRTVGFLDIRENSVWLTWVSQKGQMTWSRSQAQNLNQDLTLNMACDSSYTLSVIRMAHTSLPHLGLAGFGTAHPSVLLSRYASLKDGVLDKLSVLCLKSLVMMLTSIAVHKDQEGWRESSLVLAWLQYPRYTLPFSGLEEDGRSLNQIMTFLKQVYHSYPTRGLPSWGGVHLQRYCEFSRVEGRERVYGGGPTTRRSSLTLHLKSQIKLTRTNKGLKRQWIVVGNLICSSHRPLR